MYDLANKTAAGLNNAMMGSDMPRVVPPLLSQIEELEKVLSELENTADRLSDRFSPIMKPDYPRESNSVDGDMHKVSQSVVTDRLAELRHRIAMANSRLLTMLDRSDV